MIDKHNKRGKVRADRCPRSGRIITHNFTKIGCVDLVLILFKCDNRLISGHDSRLRSELKSSVWDKWARVVRKSAEWKNGTIEQRTHEVNKNAHIWHFHNVELDAFFILDLCIWKPLNVWFILVKYFRELSRIPKTNCTHINYARCAYVLIFEINYILNYRTELKQKLAQTEHLNNHGDRWHWLRLPSVTFEQSNRWFRKTQPWITIITICNKAHRCGRSTEG